jgi:hypothetical protein
VELEAELLQNNIPIDLHTGTGNSQILDVN